MKRARVIYNPTSGREVLKNQMIDILNILEDAGYEASAYRTTPEPFSARDEARRAGEAGFDLIVAAGGDGTINEVVSGITPLEKRPMFAIIPAGTTNDYARALNIPRDNFLEAARIIANNQPLAIDVGQFNEQYFINIAAGGYLTDLTYDVPAKLKTIFGYLAYLAKGAEKLPQVRPIMVRIQHDEGTYEGFASMFFVALTNSVGGFEQLVPDANLTDGKFTLLVIKTANLFEMLQIVNQMLLGGKHINNPNVLYVKTRYIKAEAIDGSQLMINVDGEYGGDAPAIFRNLQQHINVFANLGNYPAVTPDDVLAHEAEQRFKYEMERMDPFTLSDLEQDQNY
ncbi:diacylglycerol kinase [Atopobacter phocae]|uniref:diacylglycerol kinase n=1 Tax=Atopobacter phocae TaxID=136492 RepID=UPI00046EAD27|nr:diacylglycerol kinase [Atopobacter phocae]